MISTLTMLLPPLRLPRTSRATRAASCKPRNSKKLRAPKNTFLVQAVVGHVNKRNTATLFEVKWLGYPSSQNTLEPLAHFVGGTAYQRLLDYKSAHPDWDITTVTTRPY